MPNDFSLIIPANFHKQPEFHELIDFLVTESIVMEQEYMRIQRRATEDPGTAGDAGEENWAELLRGWLPPIYPVITKGRLLTSTGKTSPQIDILILHPYYPKKLLNRKLYFASYVLAAFECKLTLQKKHIEEAIKTSAYIKNLYPIRYGTPYKELHSPIIYGLLAHSHNWKNAPTQTVTKHLSEADLAFTKHPREMLDFMCIADLATWSAGKNTWNEKRHWHENEQIPQTEDIGDFIETTRRLGSASTMYAVHTKGSNQKQKSFTPIGVLMTTLLSRLAREDEQLRGLAEYFLRVGVQGSGIGHHREWGKEIYSPNVFEELVKMVLLPAELWGEWGNGFF